MPDIDFQRIVLNLIPKKGDETVVFYASQYETTRPFIADLMWGETEFAPGDDCWAEIDIRKNDDNLVVITDDVAIDNNEVSVILPVQALTCIGKNLGQVKIYAGEDQLIAALNFILEVQADPLAGGVTSETAIDNLTEQIEEITQQVIGDDYYDKTEVDGLLDLKADKATTYTKTEVNTALNLKADKSDTYTKTQTDNLLSDKADKATTYTKTQVDSALALKANSADLATVATTGDYDDLLNKPTIPAAQVQSDWEEEDNTDPSYIKNKPDIENMIADALFAVMPVGSVGPSAIASFETELAAPLQSVIVDVVASQASGTPTPSTPLPITGYSSANITRCGVNLFDKTSNQVVNGYFGGGGNIASNSITRTVYVKCKPNTTYTVSKTAGQRFSVAWFENLPDVGAQTNGNIVNNTASSITITTGATAKYLGAYVYNQSYDTGTAEEMIASVQIAEGTDTTYHAYNGQTYAIAFGQTVYGGVLDVTRGKLTVTHANIASYNGESINEPWLSSMDVYVPNTTPSTGAQVVYPLTTPFDIDLTPEVISAIVGENNVYSDTGDTTVQYKDSIQHYIDSRV